MLDIPGFAGIADSLEWFATLACQLLRKAMQVILHHSLFAFDRFIFCVLSVRFPRLVGK